MFYSKFYHLYIVSHAQKWLLNLEIPSLPCEHGISRILQSFLTVLEGKRRLIKGYLTFSGYTFFFQLSAKTLFKLQNLRFLRHSLNNQRL